MVSGIYERPKGFTLVELLIVIVVIAILAAISVVAYNGVQTRANNTQTIEATKQYIKAYHMYALDKGSYPAANTCLGEGYPGANCLAQSGTAECFSYGGMGVTYTAVRDALAPYMGGKVASPSMQQIRCGSTTYVGMYAGYSTTTERVVIISFLKGDTTCPDMSPNVASSSRAFQDDATVCRYNLGPAA